MDKQESENSQEDATELAEDFARVVEAGYESSLGQSDDSSVGFAEHLERQLEQNRNASFQYRLLKRTREVWATNLLVAINVIVYLIQLTQGIDWLHPEVQPLLDWGANYAPLTFGGDWWRLVTCMFLHAGILHLLMNMYGLKMLGNFVERLVGTWSFLALFFLTGIAGSLTSLYGHTSVIPSVGASGAICGIFGVLIGYVFWQRHSFPSVFVKAVRNSIILVVVLNAILGYFMPNVDEAAHLGGTVLGVLIGIFLSQPFGSFNKSQARKRAVALTMLGVLATVFAIKTFPAAPVDLRELENDRVEISHKIFKRHNQLIRDLSARKISDSDAMGILEEKIISPWSKLLERYRSIHNLHDVKKELLEKEIKSMQFRLEAWRSFLEALKTDNFPEKKQKIDEWNVKWKKAEEFDKSLREDRQ